MHQHIGPYMSACLVEAGGCGGLIMIYSSPVCDRGVWLRRVSCAIGPDNKEVWYYIVTMMLMMRGEGDKAAVTPLDDDDMNVEEVPG